MSSLVLVTSGVCKNRMDNIKRVLSSLSFTLRVIYLLALVHNVESRGRMLEPAQRSSLWRRGYKAPINNDDDGLNCGGMWNQWYVNGGLCGVCGDPWQQRPRANEGGGKYSGGIIARRYPSNEKYIKVAIEVTTFLFGNFEFRLCPHNNVHEPVTQDCLDQNLLEVNRHGKTYRPEGPGIIYLQLRIPPGLTCTQCVLQWKWHTGNDWGICPDGSSKMGCGQQEEYYNCADIAIDPVEPEVLVPPQNIASAQQTVSEHRRIGGLPIVPSQRVFETLPAGGPSEKSQMPNDVPITSSTCQQGMDCWKTTVPSASLIPGSSELDVNQPKMPMTITPTGNAGIPVDHKRVNEEFMSGVLSVKKLKQFYTIPSDKETDPNVSATFTENKASPVETVEIPQNVSEIITIPVQTASTTAQTTYKIEEKVSGAITKHEGTRPPKQSDSTENALGRDQLLCNGVLCDSNVVVFKDSLSFDIAQQKTSHVPETKKYPVTTQHPVPKTTQVLVTSQIQNISKDTKTTQWLESSQRIETKKKLKFIKSDKSSSILPTPEKSKQTSMSPVTDKNPPVLITDLPLTTSSFISRPTSRSVESSSHSDVVLLHFVGETVKVSNIQEKPTEAISFVPTPIVTNNRPQHILLRSTSMRPPLPTTLLDRFKTFTKFLSSVSETKKESIGNSTNDQTTERNDTVTTLAKMEPINAKLTTTIVSDITKKTSSFTITEKVSLGPTVDNVWEHMTNNVGIPVFIPAILTDKAENIINVDIVYIDKNNTESKTKGSNSHVMPVLNVAITDDVVVNTQETGVPKCKTGPLDHICKPSAATTLASVLGVHKATTFPNSYRTTTETYPSVSHLVSTQKRIAQVVTGVDKSTISTTSLSPVDPIQNKVAFIGTSIEEANNWGPVNRGVAISSLGNRDLLLHRVSRSLLQSNPTRPDLVLNRKRRHSIIIAATDQTGQRGQHNVAASSVAVDKQSMQQPAESLLPTMMDPSSQRDNVKLQTELEQMVGSATRPEVRNMKDLIVGTLTGAESKNSPKIPILAFASGTLSDGGLFHFSFKNKPRPKPESEIVRMFDTLSTNQASTDSSSKRTEINSRQGAFIEQAQNIDSTTYSADILIPIDNLAASAVESKLLPDRLDTGHSTLSGSTSTVSESRTISLKTQNLPASDTTVGETKIFSTGAENVLVSGTSTANERGTTSIRENNINVSGTLTASKTSTSAQLINTHSISTTTASETRTILSRAENARTSNTPTADETITTHRQGNTRASGTLAADETTKTTSARVENKRAIGTTTADEIKTIVARSENTRTSDTSTAGETKTTFASTKNMRARGTSTANEMRTASERAQDVHANKHIGTFSTTNVNDKAQITKSKPVSKQDILLSVTHPRGLVQKEKTAEIKIGTSAQPNVAKSTHTLTNSIRGIPVSDFKQNPVAAASVTLPKHNTDVQTKPVNTAHSATRLEPVVTLVTRDNALTTNNVRIASAQEKTYIPPVTGTMLEKPTIWPVTLPPVPTITPLSDITAPWNHVEVKIQPTVSLKTIRLPQEMKSPPWEANGASWDKNKTTTSPPWTTPVTIADIYRRWGSDSIAANGRQEWRSGATASWNRGLANTWTTKRPSWWTTSSPIFNNARWEGRNTAWRQNPNVHATPAWLQRTEAPVNVVWEQNQQIINPAQQKAPETPWNTAGNSQTRQLLNTRRPATHWNNQKTGSVAWGSNPVDTSRVINQPQQWQPARTVTQLPPRPITIDPIARRYALEFYKSLSGNAVGPETLPVIAGVGSQMLSAVGINPATARDASGSIMSTLLRVFPEIRTSLGSLIKTMGLSQAASPNIAASPRQTGVTNDAALRRELMRMMGLAPNTGDAGTGSANTFHSGMVHNPARSSNLPQEWPMFNSHIDRNSMPAQTGHRIHPNNHQMATGNSRNFVNPAVNNAQYVRQGPVPGTQQRRLSPSQMASKSPKNMNEVLDMAMNKIMMEMLGLIPEVPDAPAGGGAKRGGIRGAARNAAPTAEPPEPVDVVAGTLPSARVAGRKRGPRRQTMGNALVNSIVEAFA